MSSNTVNQTPFFKKLSKEKSHNKLSILPALKQQGTMGHTAINTIMKKKLKHTPFQKLWNTVQRSES